MVTNYTSCTLATTATTLTNSSLPVATRHSLTLPGAMVIPGGLFNMMLVAAAILLIIISCCRRWINKGFPNLCCYVAILVTLLLYMVYTVSTLVILLLQHCREVQLFLAVLTANLLLGTVAITTGPYLLYCLLVSKKHVITNSSKIEPRSYI